MREKWWDFSPACIALLCLIGTIYMHLPEALVQLRTEDLELISNCVLFGVEVYGLIIGMLWKKKDGGTLRIVCDESVVVIAYIVNAKVFGHEIQQISDLLSMWHIIWLLLAVLVVLLLTDIGRNIFGETGRFIRYGINRAAEVALWLEKSIKKVRKDVLFSVIMGMAFYVLVVYKRNLIFSDNLLSWSIKFWLGWILLCFLVKLFCSIQSRLV